MHDNSGVGIGRIHLRKRKVIAQLDFFLVFVDRVSKGVFKYLGDSRFHIDSSTCGELQHQLVRVSRIDRLLQHLAHHVDVGQARQTIRAVEFEIAQVGAAAEENVLDGVVGILRLAPFKEHQEVGKVRGGAEHRTALLTLTEVAGLE